LGYPLVFQLARSIAAPADLPPEAIAYYDAMFKRLTETSGWQAYLEENMVTPAYMDSAAATRYAEELNTFYAEMLKRLGVIQ
jgi:putative tricarboxylic transport membrane protein